jgi:hypothetical protein
VEGSEEAEYSHPNGSQDSGGKWEWEVEVVPLVVGQRSVKEKEYLETFKLFGIGKEDAKKIIHRLGHTYTAQRA